MSGSVLLLSLLLPVVQVHSLTFPYVSFRGRTLANHSLVDLSQVGEYYCSQCHTNVKKYCTRSGKNYCGDWKFPNGTKLPLRGRIYQTFGYKKVRLCQYDNNAASPSGIYHCNIRTIDNNYNSVRGTVYVGLYDSDEGIMLIYI